jgi:hypothetical protein
MHPVVLLPEGRIDYEWLTLMLRSALLSETSAEERELRFAADVGIVLTHDARVVETFSRLQRAAPRIVPLVDGDSAGRSYISSLTSLRSPPTRIIRWPDSWTIESVVGWICEGAEESALAHARSLEHLVGASLAGVQDLVAFLQSDNRSDFGIKGNYLAYDDLASGLAELTECRSRCREVLESLRLAASSADPQESIHLERDEAFSTDQTAVYCWRP